MTLERLLIDKESTLKARDDGRPFQARKTIEKKAKRKRKVARKSRTAFLKKRIKKGDQ